ncbi:uncharacterized protein LOC144153458 [Haemaphysalis longicornis]
MAIQASNLLLTKKIGSSAAGELVRVHVNLVILDIGDIDEYNLDFHLQVYVTLHWRDAGIVVDEGFGPDGLTLPSYIERRLWRPTIVFDNAEFADGRPPGATTIYDDKQLATTVRYNLRVRCDVDFTYYPLDSQHCALLVRSGAEDVSYVWLQWAAGGATIQLRGPNNNNFMVEAGASGSFNYSLRIGKHTVVLSTLSRARNSLFSFLRAKKHTFTCEHVTLRGEGRTRHDIRLYERPGSFPVLYMPFVFRRRITSRVIKTYLPSSLVVMLSWASFWIDLSSISARISLVINCVLTVTIQIGRDQSTFWLLNALDVWLFTCELFLVAAVIELAVAFTVGKWTAVKNTRLINEAKAVLDTADIGELASLRERLQANNDELERLNVLFEEHLKDEEVAAEMEAVLKYEDAAKASDDVKGLRKLMNYVHCHMRGLKALSISSSTYATMLTDIILQALPSDVVVGYHRLVATSKTSSTSRTEQQDEGGRSLSPTTCEAGTAERELQDIEKAFLQICIREQDRDALRFLWFKQVPSDENPKPEVEEWMMTRWEIDELRRLAEYAGLESELSEILRAGGESVDKTPGPPTAGEPMEEKLDEVEPEEEQQALETHALVSFLKVTRKFQDPRDPVDLRCRCVFPITFAVFVVTYWAVLSYYALRETDREVAQELARSLPVF